uniref:Hydantoinase/oxoprolinase N-terminal domain-containing protein n=1 Tax=Bionectria ochroleuca TaxID=29856 RepID=A0A8H7TWB5_BIOOC
MSSNPTIAPKGIRFAIDRGGTFTDVWAAVEGQPDIVLKLLSANPENYADVPSEGIRRVLQQVTGTTIPRSSRLPKEHIESIWMGTTVARNALVERKGTRHALVVTEGLHDLLDIDHQSRLKLFALDHRKPDTLYEEVVEISERITVEDFEDRPEELVLPTKGIPGTLEEGSTGDVLRIIKPLDVEEVKTKLLAIREKGIDALVICFAHSYLYPQHEEAVANIAMELGFTHISASSSVDVKMIKMISRGSSASADAYLTPEIQRYVQTFAKGFGDGNLDGVRCEFMQSDGGLVSYKYFSGLKAILSGPTGGVVGHTRTSYDGKTPVVGFDMGGTSTDVSRYGGSFEHVFETTTAGVAIQSPQLTLIPWQPGVAASCVGKMVSLELDPRPGFLSQGWPLTVTDANLMLGRLLAQYFPSIFGPNEDQPLDDEIVRQKFTELADTINRETGRSMTPMEVANGFIDVANEAMGRLICAITEARGHDTSAHNLGVSGGAGGQNACDLAKKLDIKRVIIHSQLQEPSSETLSAESMPKIQQRTESLKSEAKAKLLAQGIDGEAIRYDVYLHLRYEGTETQLMIHEPEDGHFRSAFEKEHVKELALLFPDSKRVLIDDIRVCGVGASEHVSQDNDRLRKELEEASFVPIEARNAAHKTKLYFQHRAKGSN